MKKLAYILSMATLGSSAVFAEDYQFEIGANYFDGDVESGSNKIGIDGFSIYGSAYFNTVDTSKGPLLEASFLDKASGLSLTYSSSDSDISGFESTDEGLVELRTVLSNDLIIEASLGGEDGFDPAATFGVGTYITDTTEVVASYGFDDESNTSTLELDVHSYLALEGGTGISFDVTASYIDVKFDTGYGLSAGVDYFFNPAISLGAIVSYSDVANLDTTTFALGANWFITPKLVVSGIYTDSSLDATRFNSIDSDTILINAALRF